MKFKQYYRDLLYEAVIIPDIKGYMLKFDSLFGKSTYYDYPKLNNQSFDSILQSLNRVFLKDKIFFIKSFKWEGETNRNGQILIKLPDFNRNKFEKILFHELIHREQLKRIDWSSYKIKPIKTERGYYKSDKELMAYANTTIKELKQYYGDLTASFNILSFLYKPRLGISDVFDKYIKLFYNNKKILNRFYKYLYEYAIKGL